MSKPKSKQMPTSVVLTKDLVNDIRQVGRELSAAKRRTISISNLVRAALSEPRTLQRWSELIG